MKNKIIEGYLRNFIKEHGKFGETSNDIIFEHLINYLIIKKDYIDEFEISELHTDKGNDLGIDGIAILINDFIAHTYVDVEYLINDQFKGKDLKIDFVFIQSKTSEKFDSGEILKFFNGVKEFFDPSGLTYNEKIQDFMEAQNHIFEHSSRFSENPNIKLYYASLGNYEAPADLEAIKNKAKQDLNSYSLFDTIDIKYMDTKDIMSIYKDVELRIGKEAEIQRTIAFPAAEKIKDAYLGIIPIKNYIKLITDDNNNLIRTLFYENVRDYQGENPVNKEIIETINSNHQKYFGFLNNGITIVAKDLIKSGEKINIKDFQIVNGCQTSTIIYNNKDAFRDDAFITVKIIGTDNNEIINSIIRATNRQTEVKPEAFESLSNFHKELEDFYNHFSADEIDKIYYERRNKQYVQQSIPKTKIITLAAQINSYLSMFKNQPHSTHRYYGELLKANKIFSENDNLYPYYTSAYSMYKLEQLFRDNELENKYKFFKYHILMKLRNNIAGDYNLHSNNKKNIQYCNKILEEVNSDNFLNICKNICLEIDTVKNNFQYHSNSKLQRLKDFTNQLLDKKKHKPVYISKNKGLKIIRKAKDIMYNKTE